MASSLNGKHGLCPRPFTPFCAASHRLIVTPPAVFRQPLKHFSSFPATGFFRDGYCRTTLPNGAAVDPGNHAVAGIVTDEFLDFSASRGNDLRSAGLSGGCKWCLCTARWLEAYQAYRAGRVSVLGVPRVDLDATEDSALSMVDL